MYINNIIVIQMVYVTLNFFSLSECKILDDWININLLSYNNFPNPNIILPQHAINCIVYKFYLLQ